MIGILFKWKLGYGNALYALARMLLQLLLVGYCLTYIFESDSSFIVIAILVLMVFFSSWIALGAIKAKRTSLYKEALSAIFLGGGVTLGIITLGVLQLDPWYWPQYMIPIAGMIFANSMTSVSLAAERFYAETAREVALDDALKIAFNAALIPVVNSLFAVGLVALPGMMTGQILSGISPLTASRYQIMVMCMIFGSSGISAAYFLMLIKSKARKG